MKHVLWLSRHSPLREQVSGLQRLYGNDVVVAVDNNLAYSPALTIKAVYEKEGYDDMVIVAPLSVIARITELGIHPLWADMQQVKSGQYDLCYNGRKMRFGGFKRIKNVEIIFEEVGENV